MAKQEGDPYERARAICLRQLGAGPRTQAQLLRKLAAAEIDEAVAQAVVARLVEVELVDDAEYAAAWVRSRHQGRGLARRAISRELHQRGISPDQASLALAQLDGVAEQERARELVQAKLGATRGVELVARTRRLVAMLARKGYPPGLAVQVVREELALEREVDEPGRRFLDELGGDESAGADTDLRQ